MSLCMDLETIGDESVEIEIEPVVAPGNYTKQESIDKYIAEETPKRIEAARARRSLDPWSCRIIALGWSMEGDDTVTVKLANADAMEVSMLREFWQAADEGYGRTLPIITFNGRGFDLPVLIARSRLLGVPVPKIDLGRYRNQNVDLMFDVIGFGDPRSYGYKKLQWVLKRFGIPYEDVCSGKHIAAMYEAGDWPAIRQHCEADVLGCKRLAERVGVIKPRPRQDIGIVTAVS